jgi:cephalosporin hydroxylase
MSRLRARHFFLVVAMAVSLALGGAAGLMWPKSNNTVVDQFHNIYYRGSTTTWDRNTFWLGRRIQKLPMDLFVYQELLWETRPDVLVEAGTLDGGSALYFASLFDLIGHGRVITIDIEQQPNRPAHPRITYLLGSSTAPEIVRQLESMVKPGEKVMAVLDSDHSARHVRRELEIYSRMVTPGQYLVVEDTNINGHPVAAGWGAGPAEATTDFLAANHSFTIDRSREKFLVTFNPSGWLKRVQ